MPASLNRKHNISNSPHFLFVIILLAPVFSSKICVKMADRGDEIRQRVRHKMQENMYRSIFPDPKVAEETEKKLEKLKKKSSPYSIQNVCWLIASMAVFYYTDLYLAILYDNRINRLWLYPGLISISITVMIACFLIVWLSYIKKVPSDEWETRYPAAIPVSTFCFILGSVLVMIGLWPVYAFLTPFILFTIFMGVIVVAAALPGSIF
ncbi:transmembrane protein 128 [Lingula anatina]|uniref:Transmembrane protein 128 n=1 Tax=Lingula anatina TaxID=7574 RepID=A0A1S3KDI9_LINAN|nr:transmembrane protein 128 [Lingula anatina]|eukprot:XP_013420562.1 transmembrane protein 128 [Lingula anatina]